MGAGNRKRENLPTPKGEGKPPTIDFHPDLTRHTHRAHARTTRNDFPVELSPPNSSILDNVAARALATYLISGCVGRGVRLGSESSSGGSNAGGGWKSGNVSRQKIHGKCSTAHVHGKIFTAIFRGKMFMAKGSQQMFIPRDIRSS